MSRGRRATEQAQASVELALVLPLLLLLTIGLVQVVLVARDQVLVVHAAREGARAAAVGDDPVAAARARSGLGGVLQVHSSVDPGGNGRGVVRVTAALGRRIELLGRGIDIRLEASTSMLREDDAPSRAPAAGAPP